MICYSISLSVSLQFHISPSSTYLPHRSLHLPLDTYRLSSTPALSRLYWSHQFKLLLSSAKPLTSLKPTSAPIVPTAHPAYHIPKQFPLSRYAFMPPGLSHLVTFQLMICVRLSPLMTCTALGVELMSNLRYTHLTPLNTSLLYITPIQQGLNKNLLTD